MPRNEIAETILNTLMPEARKQWSYEVGPATVLLQLTFHPSSLVMHLDIGAVLSCFSDLGRKVSWQREVDDNDPDSPCLVIQGVVNGTLVQATFVLRDV